MRTGPAIIKDKAISIGVYISNSDGAQLEEYTINFETKWPKFSEESKLFEIGDINPEVWERIKDYDLASLKSNVLSQTYGWNIFEQIIAEVEMKYKDIVILTASIIHTLSHISYGLEKYCARVNWLNSKYGTKEVICPYDKLKRLSEPVQSALLEELECYSLVGISPLITAEKTTRLHFILNQIPN
jgi:hypothetical protein